MSYMSASSNRSVLSIYAVFKSFAGGEGAVIGIVLSIVQNLYPCLSYNLVNIEFKLGRKQAGIQIHQQKVSEPISIPNLQQKVEYVPSPPNEMNAAIGGNLLRH